MLNATQFPANATVGQQHLTLLERMSFAILNSIPCFTFLYINSVMLYTLRSKPVLRETSRYILLYSLLLADTVQLVLAQLLYLLVIGRVFLTYYVCGFLTMLAVLTGEISPLILVTMSLERYVAVCFPLRHAHIATIRNTGAAVAVVWSFSVLNVVIRVSLLSSFPFHKLESLQMKGVCRTQSLFLVPASYNYHRGNRYFVFVMAAAAIIYSYFGVVAAARSASADQASMRKARNTVLLHMVQLGLSLFSTMYVSILTAMMTTFGWLVLARIQNLLYVVIFIFPRCLSSLIYGLRDRTIRPAFLKHLCICCPQKCFTIPNHVNVTPRVSNTCMHATHSVVK